MIVLDVVRIANTLWITADDGRRSELTPTMLKRDGDEQRAIEAAVRGFRR